VTKKYRQLGGWDFLFAAFNLVSDNVFRVFATRSFDSGLD